MALNKENAHRVDKVKVLDGHINYVFIFYCSGCGKEIRAQHGGLRNHLGKCSSCCKRKHPLTQPFAVMQQNCAKSGRQMDLTFAQFCEIRLTTTCHYCLLPLNSERSKRGYFLDRMDNDGPYSVANCVTCCWRCNQSKGYHFTYEQFMQLAVVIRTFPVAKKKA